MALQSVRMGGTNYSVTFEPESRKLTLRPCDDVTTLALPGGAGRATARVFEEGRMELTAAKPPDCRPMRSPREVSCLPCVVRVSCIIHSVIRKPDVSMTSLL